MVSSKLHGGRKMGRCSTTCYAVCIEPHMQISVRIGESYSRHIGDKTTNSGAETIPFNPCFFGEVVARGFVVSIVM